MVKVKPTELKNKISVKASVETNVFSIKDNLSEFYAKQAENWAHSEGMVNGLDYSSKYYAEQSKISAENSQKIGNIIQENYNSFMDLSSSANIELQEVKGEVIDSIGASKQDAIDSIETSKQDVINEINSTKTTILNDIEFVADGEKQEIEDLIDNGKEELKESIGDVKVLTTLEIGDIGIAPLGIDESKGKRRYLNGQIIIQEQYQTFTAKLKEAVALYPTLSCSESEWQATALLTVGGQVGKFVVDNDAGTIRLPKIIMPIQGLTDLSKLAEIVEAGLPQHQHYAFVKALGTGTDKGETLEIGTGTACSNTKTGGYNNTKLVSSSKTANAGKTGNALNSIYGKSNTVQPEAIQYPYFIQVATGAETEDNITNEFELLNPYSLLDYKWSEYELNNSSWLRSEGQYNYKSTHPAVYDLLLKIYNGTETKAGVSVKLTTEAFTDYDFVLNTTDETFRLPIKVKLASGKVVVGNGKALGLYDGTKARAWVGYYTGEALKHSIYMGLPSDGNAGDVPASTTTTDSKHVFVGVTPDVRYSNIETSDRDLYLYFYVGAVAQNAPIVNLGRIQEHYTTKSMVDGRWVATDYGIVSNSGFAANKSATYDLSSYLPNDGYTYEVLFSLQAQTGATSGYDVNLSLGTDITPAFIITKGVTRASARISCVGSATVPVGLARQVTIKQWSTYPCDIILLVAVGYRRIGTNL